MTFRDSAFLAMLAGGAAALGHAPFGYWWAAFPAFAVLIWVVAVGRAPAQQLPRGMPHHHVELMADALPTPRRRPGWIAWFGGVGYFGVAMHWIVEPFLVDAATHGWMAPFALIFLAGGLALFWAAAAVLSVRLAKGRAMRALAFAVILAGAELLRGHVFTGFPWALPAYIWADTPLLGMVSLTGSYGLTLLTLVLAALPSVHRRILPGLVVAVLAFGGLYKLGERQLDGRLFEREDLGYVRLVQPNVPQHEKWQRDKVPEHLDRMLSLTAEPAREGRKVDLVVWPEAAVVYPLDQAGPILAQAARAASLGAGEGAEVITGLNRRDEQGNWYNSLVTVGPDGLVREAYDKVHLVPFGEYIPFRIEFLRAMAASSGFGFTAGEEVRLIDTALGRALPLICYEGIFPGHLFRAEERPDYILLITNDAWFGTFSGPYQHLDQARFRAVEHRLPVVRVANTGISTVISHHGRVDRFSDIDLGKSGHIDARLTTSPVPTLYSRTGDWPVLIIILLILGALFLGKRRNSIANGTRAS